MTKRPAKRVAKRKTRGGAHGGAHREIGGATIVLLQPGAKITLSSGEVITEIPREPRAD
ncbi:MAG: hypothetical protein K940chlam2_01755 [Chlamydiae bacterium]|nr:hypothetical protein [Chlamydiota bacterium]